MERERDSEEQDINVYVGKPSHIHMKPTENPAISSQKNPSKSLTFAREILPKVS